MLPDDRPPPWSIPIRDAGPDIPQRSATWVDRLPMFPMAAGAVAVFALVVGLLVVLDGSPARSGPEVLGSAVESTTTVRPAPSAESTAAPSTASTTSTSTTTTTMPPSSSTTPDTAAPVADTVDPEPADLPIHTPGDLGDGWAAQVSSVPASAGGSALARSFETVRRDVPDAIIVRGSEWASLRAGFWVILRPGYDTASDAVADCDRWGLDGRDDCFGRYLSATDEAQRTCWRDESGSLAGDCS